MAKINYMQARGPGADSPLYWQHAYRKHIQAADTLRAMEKKRKLWGAEKDALWEGWFACNIRAERALECGMSEGQLLTMFMP